ncbi:MAG TPA: 3-phosphoshikimate 1-carboxyvinyltransferase [Acidimicrobiales bacterium]|nr:3-phosphoshikimate 1-carboxyvinyltransferase [Acidimicrobiales bacterium]
MNDQREVVRAKRVRGTLNVPGDKSTSHRALILGALAQGTSVIHGLTTGQDVRATASIVSQLGARVVADEDVVSIEGPDGGLHVSSVPLDCVNSGTTMRLMSGVVSAIPGAHTLVGDASLSRRPMDRVAAPLALMGSRVLGHGERVTAPLTITAPLSLHGVEYDVPVPSAQVKSAVLLAGLFAGGHTVIHEGVRTRTTTEDMLVHAGVTVHSVESGDGRTVTVTPGRPQAREWLVPGDPSQAAFFVVLALVHPDAQVEIREVDFSPERVGYLDVLTRMGAHIEVERTDNGATLRASSTNLSATEVRAREVPSVDEVPILVVAAAAAHGVSVFHDVGELRLKESDRFGGSLALASALGCLAWGEGDDLYIEGLADASKFASFTQPASLDHRMVMAATVAMTAGRGGTIEGAATVASSYPRFFDDLAFVT